MNPDTSPTPRTDAIQFQPKPISLSIENEMLRALSRQLERELSEKTNEASNWHQHYRDEQAEKQKWKQAFIELEKEVERLREELKISNNLDECKAVRISELKNEVARLKGLLEKAILLFREYNMAEALALESRLAPAPEEPANQKRQLTKPPTTSMEENNTKKHINTLTDALENLRRDSEKHYTGYREPDHVIRDSEERHIAISKLSDAILWLHKDLVSELGKN